MAKHQFQTEVSQILHLNDSLTLLEQRDIRA